MTITLKDRLSHLTYREARKLLGPEGERLIRQGGKYPIDLDEQITWGNNILKLNLGEALETISAVPEGPKSLRFACSECTIPCDHVGAAFSFILEEKLALGLSAPPPERLPGESLSDEEMIRQAIEERKERARTEKITLKSINPAELWTDYTITSHSSGKSYRVALRGWERGDSYCSCPDFRKNTLGTCKHILYALKEVKNRFSKTLKKTSYQTRDICVHLKYGEEMELRVLVPDDLDAQVITLIRPVMNRPIKNLSDLLERIKKIETLGHKVNVYPDAEEYMNRILFLERIRSRMQEIRKDPKNHPLRKTLLKTELLPYQLDGIAFP